MFDELDRVVGQWVTPSPAGPISGSLGGWARGGSGRREEGDAMGVHRKSWPAISLLAGAAALALAAAVPAAVAAPKGPSHAGPLPGGYSNLVVIYEENHSFDNLYGEWGRV